MTRRRRPGLTEEDRALWAQVTEDVVPLGTVERARKRKASREMPAARTEAPAAAPQLPPETPAALAKPRRRPQLAPLAPIDRTERRRVVSGARPLRARIDLHGMRQSEAHSALRGFLAAAQAQGHKVVLVITGKGPADSTGAGIAGGRGVLRRLVPHWLGMVDLRPIVLGFEEAHQGHGGSGALYVHLRRRQRGKGP